MTSPPPATTTSWPTCAPPASAPRPGGRAAGRIAARHHHAALLNRATVSLRVLSRGAAPFRVGIPHRLSGGPVEEVDVVSERGVTVIAQTGAHLLLDLPAASAGPVGQEPESGQGGPSVVSRRMPVPVVQVSVLLPCRCRRSHGSGTAAVTGTRRLRAGRPPGRRRPPVRLPPLTDCAGARGGTLQRAGGV